MATPDHAASLRSLDQAYARQNRVTIPTQVREILHQLILTGKMKTGERIIERKLARQLGVGTPTIREALHALEDEGLVVRRAHQGCFVATLSNEECHQIFRMRMVLEPLAAEMAVENRGRGKLDALLAAVKDLKEAAESGDVEKFYNCDLRVHRCIWELSGNEFLVKALTQITVPLFAFTTIRLYEKQLIDLKAAADTHERTAKAVMTGTKEDAKQAVQSAILGFWQEGMKALAKTVNTVVTEERRVGKSHKKDKEGGRL